MTYDFDGKQYRQASTHQKEWGAKLIAELKLQGHERILDLGCGDGELTAQLATAVPSGAVLGIDASEGMLAEAGKHSLPNLSFRLLDIREMEFDAEFDVGFSNATLQWVKDHRAMLRGVHKALREGGVARFQFAGDGNCSNLIRVVREVMACHQFVRCFTAFEWPWYMPTVDSYRQLLAEGSAFREVSVWGEVADRHFPDAQSMIRWIEYPSLVPFLACVGNHDKQRFRDEVVQRMLNTTQQPDGRYFETFRRINLLARK